MSDDRGDTDAEPQALPGDGLREGIVDELRRRLGDALLDTHLRPNDDLWVRVSTEAWRPTGEALLEMGFEYFCFLSALDWLPSPYGRGEDDPTEPPPERSTEVVQGYAGGDDPIPGVRPGHRPAPPRRRHGQGRRARRLDERRVVVHGVRRRQLARAGDQRDVRHRVRRSSRSAPHLPPGRVRGLPAAQGLPAAVPDGQAVAGHRRRRADAGRGGPAGRRRRGRGRAGERDAGADRRRARGAAGRGRRRRSGPRDERRGGAGLGPSPVATRRTAP